MSPAAKPARAQARAERIGDGSEDRFGSARGIHLRRRAAQARPVRRAAVGGRHPHPHHPRNRAQHPDRRLGDGHGDRSRHGDRHGAGRRHRRHSPQFRAGRAGRAGPPGEEIRIRHGGEPAHHPSRGDARRRARTDEAAQHLRHSGGGGRRQRQGRQAGRHPDQPRRALRHRHAPAGCRADDQGPAGHGARGRQPGGGQAAPAPAPDREAAGGRRRAIAASG